MPPDSAVKVWLGLEEGVRWKRYYELGCIWILRRWRWEGVEKGGQMLDDEFGYALRVLRTDEYD
jgi:hypothetical protein